jgi:hypothetical protein
VQRPPSPPPHLLPAQQATSPAPHDSIGLSANYHTHTHTHARARAHAHCTTHTLRASIIHFKDAKQNNCSTQIPSNPLPRDTAFIHLRVIHVQIQRQIINMNILAAIVKQMVLQCKPKRCTSEWLSHTPAPVFAPVPIPKSADGTTPCSRGPWSGVTRSD